MISSRFLNAGYLAATVCMVGLGSISIALGENPPPSVPEKDYSSELPRIAPLSPEEALRSFEVAKGFQIELVAAEPLVFDPVAFAFDASGALFVVEMIDYSEQENDFLGRVVKLVDSDRDGKMDQRTVFVEKLSWPTAIHPWKDGVIVIAPPYMTWFRDTNNDGKHDTSELWCTGFGRSNVQGMANSLRWSPEGYIVGSTSSSGADLTGLAIENGPLVLRGRDFQIDPVAKKIQPVSGGGQHGGAFNRWGDRFATSNSDHLQQIVDLDSWLASHSIGSLPITTRKSIAVDGPQAEVYRASPVEPWRIVRTRLRMSGEAPGAVEGGGRAAGYFTGATGTWIVDASARFGIPNFDTALACDVGSNLIHRKKLESNGIFWKATRIDEQSEFVRSSDIWFRPVQLGDGPDDAVYVADMYREVIEHPKSLPPMIKKHIDLTSGTDRGRIWRISRIPDQASESLDRSNLDSLTGLAHFTNGELVEMLKSNNAWRRRTASQLLIERNAGDVFTQLRLLVEKSSDAATKVLALHTLSRLEALDDETLRVALDDLDPHVNRHALEIVRQSKRQVSEWISVEDLTLMASRGDLRVQLELAMIASQMPNDRSISLLRQLIPKALDSTTRSIIIASAGARSWELLRSNLNPGDSGMTRETELGWLASLLPYWSQQLIEENSTMVGELRKNLRQLVHQDLKLARDRALVWADGLARLPTRAASERFLDCWFPEDREAWLHTIAESMKEPDLSENERERRMKWLRFLPSEQRDKILHQTFAADQPTSLQLAAIEASLWADPKTTTTLAIDRFSQMTPRIQEPVLMALISQSESASIIADALEGKRLPVTQITPIVRQRMINHPDKNMRKRFVGLLAATQTSDRQLQELIDQYRTALTTTNTDPSKDRSILERGQVHFQKNCAACHRIGEVGQDVGPPLKSLHEKTPEQLLISILDPNREVDPRFQAYSILTLDGRVLTGVIREETANQIVLAESGGKLTTVARDEIEEIKGSGQSLMPIGLQQQLPPDSLAELIYWLRR